MKNFGGEEITKYFIITITTFLEILKFTDRYTESGIHLYRSITTQLLCHL